MLHDVLWQDYGTTLGFVFELAWDAEGHLIAERPADLRTILVTLFQVQELHLRNSLNDTVLTQPEEIGWGLSEVAWADLENDANRLAPYANRPSAFNHLVFRWEGERSGENPRRIDVIFSSIEIQPFSGQGSKLPFINE